MVDRPPPSRLSVVERGGRLVVIDRLSGTTPPSAAERMAEHDRRMGHEPVRPAPRAETPPRRETPPATAAPRRPVEPAVAARVAEKNSKRPWAEAPKTQPARPVAPARPAQHAAAKPKPAATATGERKTIVTGKWWDAKGPRTIELGPKGQQILGSGFMTLFFVALITAVVALVISPILFFAGLFVLLRFSGRVIAPFGASLVDKALAERN
ncbi:MAG TPA: hypothetical protein PKD99_06725 [Sphingopyxis sp.]|nr:hypothetical protein [Sphingopyxis sp.]HMP44784.1 hypothetical protein [Sphingopyxis sp.]HMQ18924.1 hypothetical protein [Sphingopyxis sp.]